MAMTKHEKKLDPDGRHQKTIRFEEGYYHSNLSTLRVSSGQNVDTLIDFSEADLEELVKQGQLRLAELRGGRA